MKDQETEAERFSSVLHNSAARGDRAMSVDVDRILRETFVVRAEHHLTIGSTNDRAAQCARQGTGELPLLVVADRQTAGRGQGANRWWTGPGALAFSLLIDGRSVDADRGRSPLVALATAVAIVETIAPLLPEPHRVGIHWPNDVMADQRKLAGILIEVLPDRRHIVGVGLNTNNSIADAPAELQATAATLRDLTGHDWDQTQILVGLLNRFEEVWTRVRDEPHLVAARAEKLCLQRGQMVRLAQGGHVRKGLFAGIAPDGAIQLEMPAGRECFYSGSLTQDCQT